MVKHFSENKDEDISYKLYGHYASGEGTIPNPLTIFPKTQSDRNSKIVISVGRYEYQKGFDMLIDAWSYVAKKHPDWQLRIFGPGDYLLYQRQADRLGLQDVIHCYGATDKVYDEMAKASIFWGQKYI